jgi:hypothetical protein
LTSFDHRMGFPQFISPDQLHFDEYGEEISPMEKVRWGMGYPSNRTRPIPQWKKDAAATHAKKKLFQAFERGDHKLTPSGEVLAEDCRQSKHMTLLQKAMAEFNAQCAQNVRKDNPLVIQITRQQIIENKVVCWAGQVISGFKLDFLLKIFPTQEFKNFLIGKEIQNKLVTPDMDQEKIIRTITGFPENGTVTYIRTYTKTGGVFKDHSAPFNLTLL